MLDPMAQDEEVEQEMLVVEEEQLIPPQMDPQPEMGAAAAEAAVYDTSPSLLRNPPPIPAETAHSNAPDMAQLVAILARMENGMKDEMEKMRGEMQQIGRGLQAGTARIVAVARGEARTTAGIMATPRAATNELRGSAPAGEDRVSWETCRARKATEKVTERGKLIGVTGTCTR